MGTAVLAGAHQMPGELKARGIPPHWSGHIQVDDVDASLTRAQAAGAMLQFEPSDVPGVGRFAVVTDPSGAHFYLFTPNYEAAAPAPMSPGSIAWHELHSPDPATALQFYTELFGWRRDRAIDMGPMGTYQLFTYGGTDRGGMMAAPAGTTPRWLYYFAVEGIDTARDRVIASGGTVLQGPQEVPGGAWTLTCRDPQGGDFALVAPRR